MDFSFVGGDAGLQRKQAQPPARPGGAAASPAAASPPAAAAASPGQGSTPTRGIAIPSFREVQQAERQRAAAPNFFRPSGSGGAQAQRQQQPQQQGHVPAFLGGLGGRPPQPQAQAQAQAQAQRWPSQGAQAFQQPSYQSPYQQPYQQQQYPPPAQQGPRYSSPPQPAQPPQQQQRQGAPPPIQQQQQQQQQPGYQQQQGAQQPPGQQFPANAIIVSRRQQGNPALKYIRNVRWQFADNLVPDYLVGRDAACLFLSLRYHLLKPEYIHTRIKELQRSFRLRIILCHVDTEDAVEPLAQVTRAAIGNDCTLVCGWSNQECARYLETFKSYENKPAEVIQKDLGTDYLSRINSALTTVRGVNRTDVKTLGDRFGSVAGIFKASAEELQACPGIGPTKARRLHDTFHQPFRRAITASAAAAAGHDGGGAGSSGQAGQQQQQQQQQQRGQQQQQQQQESGQEGVPAVLPAELQEAALDEEEAGGGEGEGGDNSDGFGPEDDFL